MKKRLYNQSLPFKTGAVEVDQQAQVQLSDMKVIENLGGMNLRQLLNRLEFQDDGIFNHQVGEVFTDDVAPVADCVGNVVAHRKTGCLQFVVEGVVIALFQKPEPRVLWTSMQQPMTQ